MRRHIQIKSHLSMSHVMHCPASLLTLSHPTCLQIFAKDKSVDMRCRATSPVTVYRHVLLVSGVDQCVSETNEHMTWVESRGLKTTCTALLITLCWSIFLQLSSALVIIFPACLSVCLGLAGCLPSLEKVGTLVCEHDRQIEIDK